MAIAPTLDRAHQEFMLTEVRRLMTAGAAKESGLFAIDPGAIAKVHDLLLQAKVITKPVDLKAAFDSRPLDSLSGADRQL